MRCMHEASLWDANCFITLTYDDEHLPDDLSVDVRVFQRFMKRLRKRYGAGIRFFHCGEYGSKKFRPHYHAILFNHDFEDKVLWKTQSNGERLYVSAGLQELWPQGYSSVGTVTFQSASYVARYVTKKVLASGPFSRVVINPETGEVYPVRPEYGTMSRGGRAGPGGIGRGWLEKFSDETARDDYVVMRGMKMRPPRAYDALLSESDIKARKFKRRRDAEPYQEHSTRERLKVRERVAVARANLYPKEL